MTSALSPAQQAAACVLWETTELPARVIAERFGVTKNVIVGLARRGEWDPRKPGPVRTLYDRLAELHEQFNARAGLPPGTGYRSAGR